MTAELLCKKCDVFVGFGGAGVINAPENRDRDWLATHCWCCGRSDAEVERDPRGLEARQKDR